MLDLKKLSQKDASLVQHGLKALGFYSGTTFGIPGPKTQAAYDAYLKGESPSTMAAKIVALARTEVGVRERPKNSNRGKRVQEYQAATWLEGTGWPWCAAFICWLCREAGMAESRRPKTASAYDFERWARLKKSPASLIKPASKTRIQAGDILVFDFSHIGLAIGSEHGSGVRTIEGNTDEAGSREGGGVYDKIRRVSKIRSVIRLS